MRRVEITNVTINKTEVVYFYIDIDARTLDVINRYRPDDEPVEKEIHYNIENKHRFQQLKNFLKTLTKNEEYTWGEALRLPVGREFNINGYGF